MEQLTIDTLDQVLNATHEEMALRRCSSLHRTEFRSFTYHSVHELRAPIRRIRHRAQQLEDAGACAGEVQANHLKDLREATDELDTLVTALIAYARADEPVSERQAVSISLVVRQVTHELSDELRAAGATIECESLPTVWAHFEGVTTVLAELIRNGVRFNEKVPVIRIGAARSGDQWVISVTDNGIGVGASCRHRLFRPFERLQSKTRHRGPGLGLATCRRIVESLDGSIEFTSPPAGGSTVNVTLPAVPDEDGGSHGRNLTRVEVAEGANR